jgi:hypothetical protein
MNKNEDKNKDKNAHIVDDCIEDENNAEKKNSDCWRLEKFQLGWKKFS